MFQAAEGPTESSPWLFGVEAVLRLRVAKKSGKWYREAADCFMARCLREEAKRSRLHHATEGAKNGDKG